MKKSKNKKKTWPFLLMFFLGFLILIYPIFSNFYYTIEANNEIKEFQEKKDELDENEILRRMELAKGYNSVLDPTRLEDPYTEKEKEGLAEYARMLEVAEKIGFVEIPKIDINLPIYAGTSEEVLEKGAGHLEGTSLPIGGNNTHTVITAHRGLPKAKLFRNLDKLKKGDVFYIHNIQTVLAYEVDQILTVEPSDFNEVLVVKDKDYATLLTCTPYMINSHRLLVRGHRIDYVAPIKEKSNFKDGININYKDKLIFLSPISLALFALMLMERSRYKKRKKELEDLKNEK